jgi:hypothetical protein
MKPDPDRTGEDAREARRRVRERLMAEPVGAGLPDAPPLSPPLESRLAEAALRVRMTQGLVGQLPPQPPTLRGRAGGMLLRLMKRLLYWYTPRILDFQDAAARAIQEQAEAIEELRRAR